MRGIFFTLFLSILVSCTPALEAQPGVPAPEPVAVEQNCECGQNELCQNNECVCADGFKQCRDSCIPDKSCCTDEDCDSACTEGTCEPAATCDYAETLEDGECVCRSDYQFCEEQDRCISRDSCCSFINCGSFETCVKTSFAVQFCAEQGQKTKCKLATDLGRKEFFEFDNTEFYVQATQFKENSIDFNIGNQTITLKPDERVRHGNLTIWQEEFRVMGGFCREDFDE